MKARIKATGEIVEVAYHGLGVYVDMNKWDKEYNFDEIIILDNGDPDYWTRLEHQAAIATMQGMIIHYGALDECGDLSILTSSCVNLAHALVEKMKEEK